MVSGDAYSSVFLEQRYALCRVSIVPDDIAKAQNTLCPLRGDVIESRAQCLEIGVNIGDDRHPHASLRFSDCMRLESLLRRFELARCDTACTSTGSSQLI